MKSKLYVVTNRKLIKEGNLSQVVDKAIKAGADAIILREKDMLTSHLEKLAFELKEVINHRVPFIINSNYEVAKKVKADGIHLSYEAFNKFCEKYDGIIGCSVHSLEEVQQLKGKNVDYVIAGHIYDTACKVGLKGRGVNFLKQLCKEAEMPVIAIGGINESNVKEVLKSGASGIAVMSSVMEAADVEEAIRKLYGNIHRFV